MKLVTISTGYKARTKDLCLASVRSQVGVSEMTEHIYIDADEQLPRRSQPENFHHEVHQLDPETVVLALDGDDEYAHNGVVAHISSLYEDDPHLLMTYGQFIFSDGRPSFVEGAYPTEDYRGTPWRCVHLQTFRAHLYQRIREEDLKLDGRWIDKAQDLAWCFPALEMAGPRRVRWCPEVLYRYHLETSMEHNGTQADRNEEARNARIIRARPRYEELP